MSHIYNYYNFYETYCKNKIANLIRDFPCYEIFTVTFCCILSHVFSSLLFIHFAVCILFYYCYILILRFPKGMLEKAIFFGAYKSVNDTGDSGYYVPLPSPPLPSPPLPSPPLPSPPLPSPPLPSPPLPSPPLPSPPLPSPPLPSPPLPSPPLPSPPLPSPPLPSPPLPSPP